MKYPILISYSQINIFNDGEPEFNLWNEEQGAQGFAWREKAFLSACQIMTMSVA